jgi:hypothetical protein
MAHISIRALTIYKQGIGHFRRRGVVDERTVSLIVPRDSLNDVLKSLDIVVHAGGLLQSVDLEQQEQLCEARQKVILDALFSGTQ